MIEQSTDLDQAEEDILTYAASDEALEAAAGREVGYCSMLNYSVCGGDPLWVALRKPPTTSIQTGRGFTSGVQQ
jgi:hypothetical protein